jgi:ATP-dependent Lon protease
MIFFKDSDKMPFEPMIDEDSDFIPLLSAEDEDNMHAEKIPEILSILPLRNTVLFPGVVIPITVGRDKSINLIKDAYKGDKTIGVVTQKNDGIEDPQPEDLHNVGTVAQIIKMLRMPDGNTTVIIQGKKRFRIKEFTQNEPYYKAKTQRFEETRPEKGDEEFQAIVSTLKDTAIQIIQKSQHIPTEAGFALNNIESQNFMVNFISSNMNASSAEKQQMLEVPSLKDRATMVLTHLTKDLQMLELKNQIQDKVKVDLDKQQRDYFLHQQIKTIQEELGEKSHEQDFEELREKAKTKKWSKEIGDIFDKQMSKLSRMNPNSPEFGIQTNYLELLLDLPWNEYTKDRFDLKNAQKILR